MKIDNFFSELKRRNVYKVAIAYAVVGWLLTQVATQVFPFFDVPNWGIRLVVLIIAIGFPIAIIIAWAFELTPEGIKRTECADAAQEHSRGPIWIGVVCVAAALSLGLFLVGRFTARAPRQVEPASPVPEKSVAVLPFDSLSEDKANAYFATGVEEEILTRLAKIGELKVISRTSTARYQSKPGNLSEIAKQLGVAHVLEGSVQKAGDAVRVNVQLINAQDDSHVWAETYDRKLNDIFLVESDIAKAVADALQAKLTGHEQQALAIKPTNNPEAYDAYLRGLAAESQQSVYANDDAAAFYERAVELDPNFAVAWARLSRAHAELYSSPNDPTPARRDAAKRALETAQKLQPNSPETLLAVARYQFRVLRDYNAAEATYKQAAKVVPSSSDVPWGLALIAQRQGHLNEAVAYYDQALVLDPRNIELLSDAVLNYQDLRKFETAQKLLDRALEIQPNDLDLLAYKAGAYQAEGNLEAAAKVQPRVDAETASLSAFLIRINQLWLERRPAEAVDLLEKRVAKYHFRSDLEKGVFQTALALSQRFAGENAPAKASAEQARNILAPLCRRQPDNTFAAIVLSRAYAVEGDKNSAYQEAQRIKTITKDDPLRSLGAEHNLAVVDVLVGNTADALSILPRLLQSASADVLTGNPVTPALLRLDPMWDPLRSDEAFRKLCEQKEP